MKIKQDTLRNYSKTITKLPTINFGIMRRIYITHFYENNKSLKARLELAKQMRHSVPTAMRAYFKIIDEKSGEQIFKSQSQNFDSKCQLTAIKLDNKELFDKGDSGIYTL